MRRGTTRKQKASVVSIGAVILLAGAAAAQADGGFPHSSGYTASAVALSDAWADTVGAGKAGGVSVAGTNVAKGKADATSVSGAKADGAGGNNSLAAATSNAWTDVTGGYFDYSSQAFAEAAVAALAGGKAVAGSAAAGNQSGYEARAKSVSKQKNSSKSSVRIKGNNILARARSQTHTTIHVDGRTYLVANEVARALARYTPLGTSAASVSEASVTAAGSGYLGVNTGTKNEARVRTQN